MTHSTEIDFRGSKREVEFEHDHGTVIIWWFPDEGVCLGSDATDAERDEIDQTLWAYLEDWWAGFNQGD